MWVDILIDPCRMMMMKKCRGKLSKWCWGYWFNVSVLTQIYSIFPCLTSLSPQNIRLKYLIACNNANVKLKDFSGCVTGVIITAFVHHILDLAAFLWCTHRKFILSCYIRRLFLCGIGYVGDMGGFWDERCKCYSYLFFSMSAFSTLYSLLQE